MAEAYRARVLGSQVPSAMLTVPAWLPNLAHWLLNADCVVFLYCTERLFQHGTGHSHDAMGSAVYTESSERLSARVRMDGERGEPDAMGHTARP